MIPGLKRRMRAALCGAAIGGAAASLGVSGLLPEAQTLVRAVVWVEAAICGAAAGASTAGWYGREGVAGSARALWGGCVAAAMGIVLFVAGAGLWLRTGDGAAAIVVSDIARAFPLLALAAGLLLHLLERAALRVAALRDAESL